MGLLHIITEDAETCDYDVYAMFTEYRRCGHGLRIAEKSASDWTE